MLCYITVVKKIVYDGIQLKIKTPEDTKLMGTLLFKHYNDAKLLANLQNEWVQKSRSKFDHFID